MGMSRCYWYQMSGWSSGLWFERNTWWNYFHSKIVRMFTSTPHDSQVTSNPRNHGSWHLNTLTTLIHLIHILNTFLGHINLQNTTIFAACGVNYLSNWWLFVPFIYHESHPTQTTKQNRWTVWAPLAWPRNSIANWDSPQITHGGIPAVVNHLKPVLPGQAPRFEEHPANQVSPSKTCPFFSFWGVNFMSETNWARFRTFVSLWENIVWTKEPLPKNIHHMSQKFYINKDLDLFWFSSPAFHFRTKLPPSDLKSSWHYRTFFGTNC